MSSEEISRREFLKQMACASLAMLTIPRISLWAKESPSPKPNILFIFTDDHAVQAISAYGSKINQTPNIDRIARNGVIFTNSFCANSICAPSRACVLTGKFSHENGQMDNTNVFDGSQATFPKLLREAGYQTALIGKWHLKSDPTGFDHWEILPGQGRYYNPEFISQQGKTEITGYCTDIITDKSIEWLQKCYRSKPFLLLCQHKAPHRNWCPGPKHLTMYNDVEIPEPPTLFDDYSGRSEILKQNEMEIGRHMMMGWDLKIDGTGVKDALGRDWDNAEYKRMNPEQKKAWDAAYDAENKKFLESKLEGKDLVRWKYQRYVKDYLRCIASLDDNIGRILDYLEQSGKMNNTLVVYSSDQGFYLGEHGWYDKRWMYEESFRMPLVMSWPARIKSGTRIDRLVQNIDHAPTILEAAGLLIPEDMQGDSMWPLFDRTNPDWRDTIYYHYYEQGEHNVPRHDGVRTQRYKLIHYYDNKAWELFDLEKDPHELKSMWDNPGYADVQTMMIRRYHALRKQYDVPPLVTE
jgi:N-acetylglucosamine-6-sulfatase